jgi:hypothetical protein
MLQGAYMLMHASLLASAAAASLSTANGDSLLPTRQLLMPSADPPSGMFPMEADEEVSGVPAGHFCCISCEALTWLTWQLRSSLLQVEKCQEMRAGMA